MKYYPDVKDNETAKQFVLEVLKNDLTLLKQNQKEIHDKIKNFRGNRNG